MTTTTTTSVDVLIVGAGLSGIGAAYHLKTKCPKKTFAIVESRAAIGGTWDLFKYPGIRSDSDMYTLGYAFRPWEGSKAIADGPAILDYIKDTAREHGIDKQIRFNHRVVRASWSSATSKWSVVVMRASDDGGDPQEVTFLCSFLFMCTGYYDYAGGYTPEFPGVDRFGKERIIHPQKWPEDLDYTGKRVVVIGSGATAITLIPELAKKAAHVTMLQRSPSYILAMPSIDVVAKWLHGKLPSSVVYDVARWKNVGLSMALYNYCRKYPERAKKLLVNLVRKSLPADYDVETHFSPSYGPWDQRLCLAPHGDIFKTIREGKADVVTDHIKTFTENGIELKSGKTIDADLIVTATGLKLLFAGGVKLDVDGKHIEFKNTMSYKGTMLSDVPNFAGVLGYTNASWTLKADLVCDFICRMLNTMDKQGVTVCIPRVKPGEDTNEPLMNLQSGYVYRALEHLPKQGAKAPWRLRQNYVLDLFGLRYGAVDDGSLELVRESQNATAMKRN